MERQLEEAISFARDRRQTVQREQGVVDRPDERCRIEGFDPLQDIQPAPITPKNEPCLIFWTQKRTWAWS